MFSHDQIAGIIALVALGANFMGMALLLLFNPRSRAVRWFALFTLAQLLWLLLQGLMLLTELDRTWWIVYQAVVHILPALFFAAMLVQRAPAQRWQPLLPIAAGVLSLIAFGIPVPAWFSTVWHSIMWGVPALLYARRPWRRQGSRSANRLGALLGAIVPLAVLGSILLEGGFVLFVLPVLTVIIQLMLFYGVVYHRYYDIEVRAARSGELAAAAAEHDRLALLGELSATIAHEVRNPLTGIRSLTQMIAESPLDDERRGRYTGVILDEITRLDRIVGNLTDLARRSTPDNTASVHTPIATLFEDLAMLVAPRARRAAVTLRVQPTDVTVLAPRDALAQALLNLLINGVEHSPPHGTVHLHAEQMSDHVDIVIRDEGPGVPVDQRARIFEPFTSTGGTGLGLAVVRRLAAEHAWTVAVDDAPEGGARFTLRIPAHEHAGEVITR
jgi:signal transduction histidine kinase